LLPWQQISFSILTPGWNNNGIPQEFLLYPTLLPGWENGLCMLCHLPSSTSSLELSESSDFPIAPMPVESKLSQTWEISKKACR
jgi:hypothetical protein